MDQMVFNLVNCAKVAINRPVSLSPRWAEGRM
jgi:hypothetical protein